MRPWLGVILIVTFGMTALGAQTKGPEIKVIDDRVSIHAEAIPLGRLLRLFDMATGMKSTVPPELANRNISVRISNLSFDDAVEKIFEGVPLDYVVVQGEGIVVTAASQRLTGAETTPFPAATFNNPANVQQPVDPAAQEQPFFAPGVPPTGIAGSPQPFPGAAPNMQQQQQGQQPAMIQTPFGPIPNPRANQQPMNGPAIPGSQPFGLTNPANPLGDGSVPTYNPNPAPASPAPGGIPATVPNMAPFPPIPGQVPRRPGGQ